MKPLVQTPVPQIRKKIQYVYIVEYYSAIKNKIMSFTGKWIELK
jgi:hypothetical protein